MARLLGTVPGFVKEKADFFAGRPCLAGLGETY
jgi:hypothetical protein